MTDKDERNPETLNLLSIFSTLSQAQQQQIIDQTTHISIQAGANNQTSNTLSVNIGAMTSESLGIKADDINVGFLPLNCRDFL